MAKFAGKKDIRKIQMNELSPYPKEIAKGQWGVFLHVREKQVVFASSSVGAVVYRVKKQFVFENDWMSAWNNPLDPHSSQNTAYTEIHEAGHFNKLVLDKILKKPKECGTTSKSECDGCLSSVKIGNEIIPIFEAVLMLKNVN
nr:23 kDa jasmonate-induced protein-like [Ziziphus jujuba var. spinosa]